MKICHNCGRELENSMKNCIRCNEEQFDDAVIFKTTPKPPPEVKIRTAPTQTPQPHNDIPTPPPVQQAPQPPAQQTPPPPVQQAPPPPVQQAPPPYAQQAPTPPVKQTPPPYAQQALPPVQETPPPPVGEVPTPPPVQEAPPTEPVSAFEQAEIEENILEEILASETIVVNDKKKSSSLAVLILLILVFVIVIVILRPYLISTITPTTTTTIPVPTTPVQQPVVNEVQETVDTNETTDTADTSQGESSITEDISIDEVFPHIEYVGKTLADLDFDVSQQNENTFAFKADDASISFIVDEDKETITSVVYETKYVVNATDEESVKENVEIVTQICKLFNSQDVVAVDDTTALNLVDLTSSSLIEDGVEKVTYKAAFMYDDLKVNTNVDYMLVAGLYSVVQKVEFSTESETVTTGVDADEVATPVEEPVSGTVDTGFIDNELKGA